MAENNYRSNDLIDLILNQYKDDHPRMSGALWAALASVLIRVEVEDPELFQKIMKFEMAAQERMKSE